VHRRKEGNKEVREGGKKKRRERRNEGRVEERKEVKKEESPRIIPNSFFLSLFTPVHHHLLLAQTPKSYLKLLISLCKLFLL